MTQTQTSNAAFYKWTTLSSDLVVVLVTEYLKSGPGFTPLEILNLTETNPPYPLPRAHHFFDFNTFKRPEIKRVAKIGLEEKKQLES